MVLVLKYLISKPGSLSSSLLRARETHLEPCIQFWHRESRQREPVGDCADEIKRLAIKEA